VAQRYESLASLFALLTLYATARGATAERKKGWWYAAVVAACLLGMGSKESMITAPLLVLAYDWAYLSGGSWREMVRRRGGLYAGLLLAVAALAILMRCKLKAVDDAFYVWQGASPLRYLFTEAGVILRYLRLSIWPSGQCFDYAWPLAERAGEVLGPLLTVGCLGVLSLAGLARRKAWGFPATAFFILLAPSSSLIARPDPLVEHRVYLPLAAVLTLVWGGVVALCRSIFPARSRQATWRWVAGACLAAVLAALATATFRRNASFESAVALWSDVVAKRPENGRGWLSLSCSLLGDRRDAEAAEAARQALRRMVEFRQLRADVIRQADHRPSARNSLAWRAWYYAQAENCLGVALARQGREAEAIEHFDEALRLFPDAPSVYANRSLAVAASSGHSPSKKEQPRP
jgi:tetratricopeptide (TPR) repeat protein